MRWVLLLVSVLLLGDASAFAVTSFYNSNFPLSLESGESKEIEIILSNPGIYEERVEVSLVKGQDIARILGEGVYDLSPGEEVRVSLEISIPGDSNEDSYEVSILADSLSSGGEETVSFSPSYITSFDVFVGEIPESEVRQEEREGELDGERSFGEVFVWILYSVLVLSILVVLFVIIAVARRKKLNPGMSYGTYNVQ